MMIHLLTIAVVAPTAGDATDPNMVYLWRESFLLRGPWEQHRRVAVGLPSERECSNSQTCLPVSPLEIEQ